MVNVPSEINEFLKGVGNTLLVKGAAGTGKTTLSLELLSMFPGVYVSTRVSKDDLIKQYPWLLGSISEDSIIDARRACTRAPSADLLTAPDEYFKMPGPLQLAYRKIKQLKPPSVAVFDSWDALICRFELCEKQFGGGRWKRGEIEALLLDAFSELNTNIVLITERTKETLIDFFADGIVILHSDLLDGRQLRRIDLAKLRGMRIERPRYLFTLKDAQFRSFTRVEPTPIYRHLPEKVVKPDPIPDAGPGIVSTGIPDLDEILNGGFVQGSVNLYEAGTEVGQHIAGLCIPIVINTLNLGRGAFGVPTCGTTFPQVAQDFVLNFVDRKEVAETFWVMEEVPDYITKVQRVPKISPVRGQSFEEDLNLIESHQVELARRGPLTSIFSFDGLEYRYGTEAVEAVISRYFSRKRWQQGVDVWVVRSTQRELLNTFTPMANTHWMIELINGTLTLRGIIPDTGIYVVQPHLTRGYPEIELVPID